MLYELFLSLSRSEAGFEEKVAAAGGQIIRAKQGQAVYHAGDPSDAVYLLVEGEARAFVSSSGRVESRTTQLLRAPAILGDRDILAECPAQESAVLLTVGKLVSIEADAFRAAVAADARLKSLLLFDLAKRNAVALALFALGLSSTQNLLEAVLMDLSLRGSPARIATADLAAITGAAPKTIHRALAALRARDPAPFEDADPIPAVFHSLSSPSLGE